MLLSVTNRPALEPRSQRILSLPRALDRSVHDLVRVRQLAVNDRLDAAAYFERMDDGTFILRHSHPRVRMVSNRPPRLLCLEPSRALVWAKEEGKPQGLYRITTTGSKFLQRLDRLDRFHAVGEHPTIENVVAYGSNVDDPAGVVRCVRASSERLLPRGFNVNLGGQQVVLPGHDQWMSASLKRLDRQIPLPFRSKEVDACILLWWDRLSVYLIHREFEWVLCYRGYEVPIPGQVLRTWCSPERRAFALYVELPGVVDELMGPTPRRLLLMSGPAGQQPIRIVSGPIQVHDVTWSPTGTELAVSGTRTEFVDLTEGGTQIPFLSTSSGDERRADPSVRLTQPVVDDYGQLIAHVAEQALSSDVFSGDFQSHEPYAWSPVLGADGRVSYACIDDRGLSVVRL